MNRKNLSEVIVAPAPVANAQQQAAPAPQAQAPQDPRIIALERKRATQIKAINDTIDAAIAAIKSAAPAVPPKTPQVGSGTQLPGKTNAPGV